MTCRTFAPTIHPLLLTIATLLPASLLVSASAFAQKTGLLHAGNRFSANGCYAMLENAQLTIGNTHQKRTWEIRQGKLFARSLLDLDTGKEWLAQPAQLPSPTTEANDAASSYTFRGGSRSFAPEQQTALLLELEAASASSLVKYEFQVFPDAHGIRMWTVVERSAAAESVATTPSGAEPTADALEHLLLQDPHLRLVQVLLRDRTDQHGELVFENEWLLHPNEALLELQGNLFVLENTLTGQGIIFLKEAPEPEMRPVHTAFDLWFSGSSMIVPEKSDTSLSTSYKLAFFGNGIAGTGRGYAHTLLTYHGGTWGRTSALQQFQRQLRMYNPDRDGLLLSNTWGDRSYEGKLNEEFIRREIDAGKALGVDVVQIDGGWQLGQTAGLSKSGGVWEGYWASNAHFWDANPARFPNGFRGLADYAHARDMKLGLWFAPDSSHDFANWERDANLLLRWHNEDSLDAFKLDSVKIRSKAGERNYYALLDRVTDQSHGKILLDLDVTAETRQGYFGAIGAGPLFIENRYTDMHRYWPHQTLRNLWKLAQYVDPIRLRMEFLNSERNIRLYPNDPLAPQHYRADTLFATVMFSSPLAWLETSELSPTYLATAAPLIARWKTERASIDQGTILPIGTAPDGVSWTGFASIAANQQAEYLLIFRELNPSSTWEASPSPFAATPYRIQLLGGNGSVLQTPHGFQVTIPDPLGFVWAKLEPAQRTEE